MILTKQFIIDNILDKNGKISSPKLNKYNFSKEEIYCTYNYEEIGKCYCGNNTKLISFIKGFQTFCSDKCSANDINLSNQKLSKQNLKRKETTAKIIKTHNDRYGGIGYSGLLKDKINNTVKEKYNVSNISKSEEANIHKSTRLKKSGKIRANKTALTKNNKYGNSKYNNHSKNKETCRLRYGKDYYFQTEEFINFLRNHKEQNGMIVSYDNLPNFELYKRLVWKITNKQNLKSLTNYNKRGRIDLVEDAYHLDHKLSIFEGFSKNIPVHIIGNIANLEFIKAKDNLSKNYKSSIKESDLYKEFINKNKRGENL